MPQLTLLCLAIIALALLLGAAAYESVVMAPNYERDIPGSIATAREFLRRATPARYFRVVSPVAQVLTLGALVVNWPVPRARWAVLAALAILVLLDLITFRFHYPRLAILFRSSEPVEPEVLGRAAHEWARGNIWRIVLLLLAFIALLVALVAEAAS